MRAGSLNLTISAFVTIVFCSMSMSDQLSAGERDAADQLLSRIKVTEEGTSSNSDRDEAIRQLPFKSLTAEQQTEVRSIVNSCDLFRRLPTLTFEVDPGVY